MRQLQSSLPLSIPASVESNDVGHKAQSLTRLSAKVNKGIRNNSNGIQSVSSYTLCLSTAWKDFASDVSGKSPTVVPRRFGRGRGALATRKLESNYRRLGNADAAGSARLFCD